MDYQASTFFKLLPLILAMSIVHAQENHYYDKKLSTSDTVKSSEEDYRTYKVAVDRDEVRVVVSHKGEPVNSSMQPNLRIKDDTHGFYVLASMGSDGADLRISEGKTIRSYANLAATLALEGGYKHSFNEHLFYGGALQLVLSSYSSDHKLLENKLSAYRIKANSHGAINLEGFFGGYLPSFDSAQLGLAFSMRHVSHEPADTAFKHLGPKTSTFRYGFGADLSLDAPVTPHWFTRLSTAYYYYPQTSSRVDNFEGEGKAVNVGYTFSSLNATLGLGYLLTENKAFKYFYSSMDPKGFYAGTSLGVDQLYVHKTEKKSGSEIKKSSGMNQSEVLAVTGGYAYSLGKRFPSFHSWTVSGEFDLAISTPGRSVNDMNTARTVESIYFDALLGYKLYNNNQYYLKFGSGYTHIKTAKTRSKTGDPKLTLGYGTSNRKTPFNAGVGYQTMVSSHIGVRSEFSYGLLGTQKQEKSSFEYGFSHYTASLGAVYFFKG